MTADNNAVDARLVSIAAEAMEDAALELLGRDLGTIHRNTIAERTVAAVLAAIDTKEAAAKALEDVLALCATWHLDPPKGSIGILTAERAECAHRIEQVIARAAAVRQGQ